MSMTKKLYDDFMREVKILEGMTPGTEEYERQSVVVGNMVKNYAELKKVNNDFWDRIVKNTLTGLQIGTSALLLIWGAVNTWHFEEKGTIASNIGKMFIGLFRPKI